MNAPPAANALRTSRVVRRLPLAIGWLAVVVLLVAGAKARFALAPVAVSEADSWGWLHPALGWLGGTGFREEFEREWLYGAFITFAVKVTGSFAGYIVIQQVLGLLAAVAMWVTWRLWVGFFPAGWWLEIASLVFILPVIALYLFSPMAMLLELSIRPEGIMAFVAFCQLLAVTAFCHFRWRKPAGTPAVASGAAAIVLAWAMYVLKPNWLLAVPLTTLPVFAGIFGKGLPALPRRLAPALGLAMGFLLLWLPDRTIFEHPAQARLVLPLTLFTIHADIIRENLEDEAHQTNLPADRQRFLDEFLPLLDAELANARVGNPTYKRLGFDPDYLMYRASIFPTIQEKYRMSREDIAAFCTKNFLSAVAHRPWDYADKVVTQFGHFLAPDEATFVRKRANLRDAYAGSIPTLRSPDTGINDFTRSAYERLLAQSRECAAGAGEISAQRSLRKFAKNSLPWVPVVSILFLGALVACWAWVPLANLRGPGAMALLYLAAPAGNALTIALVHALDNSRYRFSYGPLYAFALAAMALFVIVAAVRTIPAVHKSLRRVTPEPGHN